LTTQIKLSALGFGCASVMGKVGRAKSLGAMSEAFEVGVTHFDVARSYGFGEAESVLGKFLKGKRDKLTIATKFGVVPPNLDITKHLALPAARFISKVFPQLKNNIKIKSGELLAVKCFDVGYAQKCLDESLKLLKTDYIDIYFLHDPDIKVLENGYELRCFLDAAVSAGKIKYWGATYRIPEDFLASSELTGSVTQFEGNFNTYSKCNQILAYSNNRIVTRPFLGGCSKIPSINIFFEKNEIRKKMKELEVSVEEVGLCLAAKMAGENGSVVCSMFSSHHIHRNFKVLADLKDTSEMQSILEAFTSKSTFIDTSQVHAV
jgi:diketogulonate reductase-like aldo/keto reductase